ncbi:MAG: phosphocarrier protein HPr [Fusobacteriaceae bacterium]|nr:phosphocarrier protein HPr [Fusobacteriaceae bacterium]
MASKTVVITNETGMHTRPANEFVKEVKTFNSEITLSANGKEVKAKSLLKILSLGIKKGTEVTVTAIGDDAEQAVEKLADVLANLKD